MYKILIIEDEKEIREELCFLFENEGYSVSVIENFENIEEQVKNISPNLILLDVGLPHISGYDLCIKIRKETKAPIVFVTSRNTSQDELTALSVGGDDYISKPYNIPILLARVKGVLRRNEKDNISDMIESKGLTLSLLNSTIGYQNEAIDITLTESKILWCLMTNAGKIISRVEIIEFLWDNQVYIDDNTLSVNITRIRKKLGTIGLEDYILTKRGMGYMV